MAVETIDPPLNWKEKIAKNWFNVRLGHEALMLDKIGQQQKRVFRLADKVAGKDAAIQDEDMSVSIGDQIHHHYDSHNTTGASGWAKKLIPLALAATVGGGAAVAAAWFLNKHDAPPTVTPPVITQPDSAWQLGIEVVNP